MRYETKVNTLENGNIEIITEEIKEETGFVYSWSRLVKDKNDMVLDYQIKNYSPIEYSEKVVNGIKYTIAYHKDLNYYDISYCYKDPRRAEGYDYVRALVLGKEAQEKILNA